MRLALLLLVAVSACADGAPALPSYARLEVRDDTLRLDVVNPIPGPATFVVEGDDIEGGSRTRVLARGDSALLAAVPLAGRDSAVAAAEMRVSATVGDPRARPDPDARYAFPFARGRSYRVVQAYGGSFSHTGDYARYAVDFSLAVGDTVMAARPGVIVAVVEQHTRGGNDRALRDSANFVTLHHADGMLTQYVHLAPDGALVARGDSVRAGDAIGVSGGTGFTSRPHLHFNVLQPVLGDAVSIPVRFERVDGQALRKGAEVSH